MLASAIPTKFTIPFANSGAKNAIPVASQIGITAGAASLTDGFPPLTRTPLAAGGVPPFGEDFNGILNEITAWQQWQGAGGTVPYDSTFSTAIGGYPKGALLASTTAGLFWVSTADNNTTNPDSGGSNWMPVNQPHGRKTFASSTTWTAPAGVTLVSYRAWGAGGGGGGVNGTAQSSGGAGGGYSEGDVTVVPGTTYTITVGTGGSGGAGTGANGTAGGTTSFASFCSVPGGGPGFGSTSGGQSTGGNPGSTPTGPTDAANLVGQGGNGSLPAGGGGGGGSPMGGPGGHGGYINGTGSSGLLPGGGGGGTASTSGGQAGGTGGGGLLILKW